MRDLLHSPYELVLKEPSASCPRGDHQVSFFELVYIVSGTGTQRINNSTVEYKAGDLFLLAPDDRHEFLFQTVTQLFFIRVSNAYVHSTSEMLEKMEIILSNASKEPGCVLKKKEDRITIKHIINSLLYEHGQPSLYSKELTHQYIQTILIIAARNLMSSVSEEVYPTSDKRILDILQYVQANIYFPKKLRGSYISERFGIAETYLGRYFKNETSETLQEYITHYKLKLIENRLSHSDMRINEIADEFGFTDKSHLNRFFKKRKGRTPSVYRKGTIAP